ncbi:MAG: hypothetical protein VB949_03465, partial [Pseudomonadales bacterium]
MSFMSLAYTMVAAQIGKHTVNDAAPASKLPVSGENTAPAPAEPIVEVEKMVADDAAHGPSNVVANGQRVTAKAAPPVPTVNNETALKETVLGDDSGMLIKRLSTEDFSRLSLKSFAAKSSASMALSLTTKEGDVVTLDFSQVDTMERVRFSGRSIQGDQLPLNSFSETTQRMISISVVGDLSEAELAAIDKVLSRVIKAANKLFNGSVGAALHKLERMDFDTNTLADLSLRMSMTRSIEFTQVYQGREAPLARQVARDGALGKALESFADQQRQLIDMASEVFDRKSAVRLVKSLLPGMLSGPHGAKLHGKGHGMHGHGAKAHGAKG